MVFDSLKATSIFSSISASCLDLLPVTYRQYAQDGGVAGQIDDEAAQSMELLDGICSHFDEQFSRELLTFVLQELNPLVLLIKIPRAFDTTRCDSPWLDDEALDALEDRYLYYLSLPADSNRLALSQLLESALPPLEKLVPVHRTYQSQYRHPVPTSKQ